MYIFLIVRASNKAIKGRTIETFVHNRKLPAGGLLQVMDAVKQEFCRLSKITPTTINKDTAAAKSK
jgi:hypothetical protein